MENNSEEKRVIGYSKKVLQYFFHPVNVGKIENPDVTARTGSPACGDMIKLYIKFDGDKIAEIKFQSYGCASNIATASMLTEMVKGKTIDEARKYTFQQVVEDLGGLPRIKYHCAVLAVTALRIALDKWDVKRGKKPLTEEFVRTVMSGVIDPETGESILPKVKNIVVSDDRVEIVISKMMEEAEEAVKEQVMDAFEGLDVEVRVSFE